MNSLSSQENCLNCGEQLAGKYCAKCGQEVTHLNVPFSHILKEFFGDYFHFDSRLVSSLKLLIFKPGFLTKEFIEGKRVRHIPPLRMYFFISVLYFLFAPTDNQLQFRTTDDEKNLGNISVNKSDGQNFKIYVNDDSLNDSINIPVLQKEKSSLRTFLEEKAVKAMQHQLEFGEQFSHNMPKMMFFLLPIFALLLKTLYASKKKFYFEHLIYSLHIHSFVFALLLIFIPIKAIPFVSNSESFDSLINFTIFLSVLAYLFFSLKTVYIQTTGKTIAKMSLLLLSEVFLLGIAFMITILVTALLF